MLLLIPPKAIKETTKQTGENWIKRESIAQTLEVEQRLNALHIPDLQFLLNDPSIINSYVGQIMQVLITAAKQKIPPKRLYIIGNLGISKLAMPSQSLHTSIGSRLDDLVRVTTQPEGSINRPSPHLAPAWEHAKERRMRNFLKPFSGELRPGSVFLARTSRLRVHAARGFVVWIIITWHINDLLWPCFSSYFCLVASLLLCTL